MTQAPTRPSPTGEAVSIRKPLWTRSFVLLCTSTVLCYFANYLVGVVLPLYVQNLGGNPIVIGLVFTSFSVTSFILRPLMGHLTDTWSVRGTLFSGASIIGALGLACGLPSIWVALVANATLPALLTSYQYTNRRNSICCRRGNSSTSRTR